MTGGGGASLVTVTAPREGWAPPIEVKCQPSLKLGAKSLTGTHNAAQFRTLAVELSEVQRGQGRALMVVEGASQAARLRRHLEAYDLAINTDCKSFGALHELPDFRPVIMEGESRPAWCCRLTGFTSTAKRTFSVSRACGAARGRPPKGALLNLEELKPDDVVVHIDHGIGRYRGLRHMKVADTEGDFLNLEYAGRRHDVRAGRAHQPGPALYRRRRLRAEARQARQRLVGPGQEADKAGGAGDGVRAARHLCRARSRWRATRFRIRAPTTRNSPRRFEFEETPDQLAAIDEVIRDMARPKPMDRLICGDAGFGKTEVALRAAFIAVMDGRQVAVLVPTTVLARAALEHDAQALQGLSGADRDGLALPHRAQGESRGY